MQFLEIVKALMSLIVCYMYDFVRFLFRSQIIPLNSSQAKQRAHILRIAHALEKGMAMPEPRLGFGQQKTKALIRFVDRYVDAWGEDEYSDIATATISSLLSFHKERGVDIDKICEMAKPVIDLQRIRAGTIIVNESDIKSVLPHDAEKFFLSRHSVRQFKKGKIPYETLEKLARMASKTPSVCNRQSCKVYFYDDKSLMDSILELQDGNSGFCDSAALIAVVTSDLAAFYKSGERFQGYVDGGLFAMTLVYAAHAIGLASCMLNWSQATRTDIKMRRRLQIDSSEIIVTLIAFGYMHESFRVAASPRRPIDHIFELNKKLEV